MKCASCKFWQREFEGVKISDLKPLNKGECRCPKFVYNVDQDCPVDGLVYWDAESYAAGFETGQDFGCIHFIPKEQE